MAGGGSAGSLVHDISISRLGAIGGLLAILGVVAAPITTGDTALRSARLIAADFMHADQRPISRRLLVSLPIFALTACVMMIDFNVLWRYFAWCNQTLAVFTLWAASAYLYRFGRAYIITMLPAMFMTAVCVCYILFAPSPEGFGMPWTYAVLCSLGATALCTAAFARMAPRLKTEKI
jgi:carbon starvation protein CstA